MAVGQVDAFGGAKPWMSMTLADSPARGTVMCAVTTKDGVTHWVGSFVARKGYGAWVAPLHVSPSADPHRRGGLAQRDGDRHRHAGLTHPQYR